MNVSCLLMFLRICMWECFCRFKGASSPKNELLGVVLKSSWRCDVGRAAVCQLPRSVAQSGCHPLLFLNHGMNLDHSLQLFLLLPELLLIVLGDCKAVLKLLDVPGKGFALEQSDSTAFSLEFLWSSANLGSSAVLELLLKINIKK